MMDPEIEIQGVPGEEAAVEASSLPAQGNEKRLPQKALRPNKEATAAEATLGTAAATPQPKREKAAREPKPREPLPPLAIWRNGQFETLGEAQIVKGPYELLLRPEPPTEGPIRRPITSKLEIEGQFRLPSNLLNRKAVIKIGSLSLQVYVLSTSHTGGTNGDLASFIIVQEMANEDEVRALYPQAA